MKRFARALAALATVLDRDLSAPAIDGYCAVLGHHDEDTLVRACGVFARSVRWMPKPVDFEELIAGGSTFAADERSEATRAWGTLQSVWTLSGDVRRLCGEDRRTSAGVAALGGWYAMVNGGEDPKWQRKTFIDAFVGEAQAMRREALGLPAPGRALLDTPPSSGNNRSGELAPVAEIARSITEGGFH